MKRQLITRLFATEPNARQLDLGLLGFRVLIALSLFNTHGLKKLTDIEGTMAHLPDPLGLGPEFTTWFAIFANIACPPLVALGLLTRLAVLPILSTTLMGFFVVHAADPWSVKDVPLMYSLAFLLLFWLGPGKISLDHKLFKR